MGFPLRLIRADLACQVSEGNHGFPSEAYSG
jgi:hypothetical protein